MRNFAVASLVTLAVLVVPGCSFDWDSVDPAMGTAGSAGLTAAGGGVGTTGGAAGAGAAGAAGSATSGAGGASGKGGAGGAAGGGTAGKAGAPGGSAGSTSTGGKAGAPTGGAGGASGSSGGPGVGGKGGAGGVPGVGGGAGAAGVAGVGGAAGAGGDPGVGGSAGAGGGASGSGGSSGGCTAPAMSIGGGCYFLLTDKSRPRDAAVMACDAALAGSHLADFPDKATEDLVMSNAGLSPMAMDYWFSLDCAAHDMTCNSQAAGVWTWLVGGAPTFSNWSMTPNKGTGCARLTKQGGPFVWRDANCTSSSYFAVCQAP